MAFLVADRDVAVELYSDGWITMRREVEARSMVREFLSHKGRTNISS